MALGLCSHSQADDRAVTYIEILRAPETGQAADPTVLAFGSGFLIDKLGHVITAGHLIADVEIPEDKLRVQVRFGNREETALRAQIVDCSDGNIDICLLRVNSISTLDPIPDPFQPLCRPFFQDESVTVKGFMQGDDNPILTRTGEVSSEIASKLKYTSTVELDDGMSGGPVIDGEGFVIGLNTGSSGNTTFLQPLSYGVDLVLKVGTNCFESNPNFGGQTTAEDLADLPVCTPRKDVIPAENFLLAWSNHRPIDYIFLEPSPGCQIYEVLTSGVAEGYVPQPGIEILPDGTAVIKFSLKTIMDETRAYVGEQFVVNSAEAADVLSGVLLMAMQRPSEKSQ